MEIAGSIDGQTPVGTLCPPRILNSQKSPHYLGLTWNKFNNLKALYGSTVQNLFLSNVLPINLLCLNEFLEILKDFKR